MFAVGRVTYGFGGDREEIFKFFGQVRECYVTLRASRRLEDRAGEHITIFEHVVSQKVGYPDEDRRASERRRAQEDSARPTKAEKGGETREEKSDKLPTNGSPKACPPPISATVSLSFMPILPKTSRMSRALAAGSGTPRGPSGLTGQVMFAGNTRWKWSVVATPTQKHDDGGSAREEKWLQFRVKGASRSVAPA